jgi:membrane protease YdiL (CAAX protease family)
MSRTRIIVVLSAAALVAASAGVWRWLFKRWRAGEPAIPLARRRPVPWLGRDVLFILMVAILLPGLAGSAVKKFAGEGAVQDNAETNPAERKNEDEKHETANPVVDLLGSGDWRMIALATFTAVVVAPLFEEFIFRVLLQGWLEAVWSRRRRTHRELRGGPAAYVPLVLPAALFALMHFRFGRAPPTPQDLTALFLVVLARIAAELATLGLAFAVLRLGPGATAADLGWTPRKLSGDARLAIAALLAISPPVFLLQSALNYGIQRAGIEIAPDPIPLFFLALVFGVLYQRTHRITPSLLLHAAFNGTSIILFFLT